MTNSIDPYVDSKMCESDRSDIVLEDMSEKGNVDEIDVTTEMAGGEAKQDHSRNLDEYDSSLDIPILLKEGTRFCMKHTMCNYALTRIYHPSSKLLQPVFTPPRYLRIFILHKNALSGKLQS